MPEVLRSAHARSPDVLVSCTVTSCIPASLQAGGSSSSSSPAEPGDSSSGGVHGERDVAGDGGAGAALSASSSPSLLCERDPPSSAPRTDAALWKHVT